MPVTPGVRLATEFCYDCKNRQDNGPRHWCFCFHAQLDDLEGDDFLHGVLLPRNSIKLDECKLYNFSALLDGVQELDANYRYAFNVCRVLLALLALQTEYLVVGVTGFLETLLATLLCLFVCALVMAYREEL